MIILFTMDQGSVVVLRRRTTHSGFVVIVSINRDLYYSGSIPTATTSDQRVAGFFKGIITPYLDILISSKCLTIHRRTHPHLSAIDWSQIQHRELRVLPALDQGSAVVSREFYFMTLSIFHTDCLVKTRNNYDLIPDPLESVNIFHRSLPIANGSGISLK